LVSDGLGVLALSTLLDENSLQCDEFGDGFVSLIIEPESNVDTEAIDKNFTLVIDRSGSMAGDKMVQARNAASFIVENLNEGDRFNIIVFDAVVDSFASMHIDVSPTSISSALDYIATIEILVLQIFPVHWLPLSINLMRPTREKPILFYSLPMVTQRRE